MLSHTVFCVHCVCLSLGVCMSGQDKIIFVGLLRNRSSLFSRCKKYIKPAS